MRYSKEPSEMEWALAHTAGHSLRVEETDYAGLKNATGNLATDEQYIIEISRKWHEMWDVHKDTV